VNISALLYDLTVQKYFMSSFFSQMLYAKEHITNWLSKYTYFYQKKINKYIWHLLFLN